MVQVTLNGKEIQEGGKYQDELFGSNLNIFWQTDPAKYYSLLLIDLTKNRVYALVVNIPGVNLSAGQIILPLTPETEIRRNMPVAVHVYEQPGLQTVNVSESNRFVFDSRAFAQKYQLKLVDSRNFELRQREVTPEIKQTYALPGSPTDEKVDERVGKYCRCVLEVAAKQSETCLTNKEWGKSVEGRQCYNPYAVCAKSTGTTSRVCGQNYNYNALPDKLLVAYARLNNITVPEPYNRETVLQNIQKYKQSKY